MPWRSTSAGWRGSEERQGKGEGKGKGRGKTNGPNRARARFLFWGAVKCGIVCSFSSGVPGQAEYLIRRHIRQRPPPSRVRPPRITIPRSRAPSVAAGRVTALDLPLRLASGPRHTSPARGVRDHVGAARVARHTSLPSGVKNHVGVARVACHTSPPSGVKKHVRRRPGRPSTSTVGRRPGGPSTSPEAVNGQPRPSRCSVAQLSSLGPRPRRGSCKQSLAFSD